jgi:hypothetical protein
MWNGLLNPDYSALLISFFRATGSPLAHTSVLLVIGQEIASIQWPLVAFTAMRKLVRLAERMESIRADG